MFFTHVLFSESINKYYAGFCDDIQTMIDRHGKDSSRFTARANDWKLVRYFEFQTRSEAIKLKWKIKKRGIKRFLDSLEK